MVGILPAIANDLSISLESAGDARTKDFSLSEPPWLPALRPMGRWAGDRDDVRRTYFGDDRRRAVWLFLRNQMGWRLPFFAVAAMAACGLLAMLRWLHANLTAVPAADRFVRGQP